MKINENEIWKPIPWTKGIYYASNCGRIKSVDRVIKQFNNGVYAYHHYKGRMLKLKKNSRGYEKVSLNVLGVCYSNRMVHNLVCEAFYGEIPEGYEVNHKDKNRTNNNLDNLEIVTHKENMQHAYRYGSNKRRDYNEAHSKKIAVLENNKVIAVFDSVSDCADFVIKTKNLNTKKDTIRRNISNGVHSNKIRYGYYYKFI